MNIWRSISNKIDKAEFNSVMFTDNYQCNKQLCENDGYTFQSARRSFLKPINFNLSKLNQVLINKLGQVNWECMTRQPIQ